MLLLSSSHNQQILLLLFLSTATLSHNTLAFSLSMSTANNNNKFSFCIDRGGTFTDVFCTLPGGKEVVRKLLSEDPANYPDAPTEGIRRLLDEYSASNKYPRGATIGTDEIASIRMGTTVATNALLERDGAKLALVITKGFGDLLEIGNQARPNIFDLTCTKPSLLYSTVLELDERVVLDEYYGSNDNDKKEDHKTVVGQSGETVQILKEPNLDQVRADLQTLKDDGYEALAICCMHSYTFADHEVQVGKIAEELGFPQISLSSQVMPMVKLVSRYVIVIITYYYIVVELLLMMKLIIVKRPLCCSCCLLLVATSESCLYDVATTTTPPINQD